MEWKTFYAHWMATFGQPMPDESLAHWNGFVSTVNSEDAGNAIRNLADWYFAAKERDSFTKVPTLYQFRRELEKINAESRKESQEVNLCDCCGGEGYVVILAGNFDPSDPDFPPDPASGKIKNRSIAAIACPCCKWQEYQDRQFRERVRKRCRVNSRRYELLEVVE